MAKKPVQYSVIDAFTDTAFKGNPAAVCLLEEEREDGWMQSVAAEFNISETAFLSRIGSGIAESENSDPSPRFSLRWFTPVDEVELCGHATIASGHFLFSSGLVKTNKIEFITKSGLLTAQKVDGLNHVNTTFPSNNKAGEHFSIELSFPTIPVIDCDPTEHPSIPATLNGASMLNIKKTVDGDLIVELLSGEVVAGLQPQFDELQKCAGTGVIITGIAAPGSGYDFFTRYFCPKLGINEVELCGHATIASGHFLFSSGLVKTNKIEFITKSGLLTAQKVHGLNHVNTTFPSNKKAGEHFSIELNFPTIPVIDCDPTEHPSIPATLNGASMLNIKKTINGDLIVELLSGEVVAGLQPQFAELQKCAGRGVIITGTAAPGSGYDFFTRFFCPKLGINEDPVCGSCHCALVPYWSKKLGKNDLIAYMASPRGGKLDLHLEEDTQRVLIRGEAVTVMTGTLLV